MKSIAARPRVKVSADGRGVVSHAGVGLLRELAELTELSSQVTAALADTYRGPWIYPPGDPAIRHNRIQRLTGKVLRVRYSSVPERS